MLTMPSSHSGEHVLACRTAAEYGKAFGDAVFPEIRRVFVIGRRGSGKSWMIHQHLHGNSTASNPPPPGGADNRPASPSHNPALAATISGTSDGGSSAVSSSVAEASSAQGEDVGEQGDEFGWETPVHYAISTRVQVQQVYDEVERQLTGGKKAGAGTDKAGAELRQKNEVASRPRLLLVTEFPESLAEQAIAVATAQADVLVVHADGRNESSVKFAIAAAQSAPDGVPVMFTHRGPPPSRTAHGSPSAILATAADGLDLECIRVETSKGAADAVATWAVIAAQPYGHSPTTKERVARWKAEDAAADGRRKWSRASAAVGLVVILTATVGAVSWFGFTSRGREQWEEGKKAAGRAAGLAACEAGKASMRLWRAIIGMIESARAAAGMPSRASAARNGNGNGNGTGSSGGNGGVRRGEASGRGPGSGRIRASSPMLCSLGEPALGLSEQVLAMLGSGVRHGALSFQYGGLHRSSMREGSWYDLDEIEIDAASSGRQ